MSSEAELPDTFESTYVEGIPVIWRAPQVAQPNKIALWLPPFTQTKESAIPVLERLAEHDYLVVSIDPYLHGERATEPVDDLVERVFAAGAFRRTLWPILGQTTLDARRVIDWVLTAHAPEAKTVVAGGLSMGGDSAVALCGIDPRISRVAAIVASPDWKRPGMRSFAEPFDELDQGEADSYAAWFYDELCPANNVARYTRPCAITFECGADDTHVPPEAALRFKDSLNEHSSHAGHIRVNLHEGYGHRDGGESVFVDNCIEWLTDDGLTVVN